MKKLYKIVKVSKNFRNKEEAKEYASKLMNPSIEEITMGGNTVFWDFSWDDIDIVPGETYTGYKVIGYVKEYLNGFFINSLYTGYQWDGSQYEEVDPDTGPTGRKVDAEELYKKIKKYYSEIDKNIIEIGVEEINDEEEKENKDEVLDKIRSLLRKFEKEYREYKKKLEDKESILYVDNRFIKNNGKLYLLDKRYDVKDYGWCKIKVTKIIKDKKGRDVYIFVIEEERIREKAKELEEKRDKLSLIKYMYLQKKTKKEEVERILQTF